VRVTVKSKTKANFDYKVALKNWVDYRNVETVIYIYTHTQCYSK
jgi:hypothetical protein